LTFAEVADKVGATPQTLLRWEKAGETLKPTRHWRGWQVFEQEDLSELTAFHDRLCRW
jgi:DNA-binding transcriptional MerR regulator